jgi:transcription elongation GreA/GreB family factor
MDTKNRIIQELRFKIEEEKKSLEAEIKVALDFKRSEEGQQESKYDTQGLEAGYLIDGQKARVSELEEELKLIDEIPVKNFEPNEEVGIGAILEIELNNQIKKYFLSTTGGGTLVNINGVAILVITVFSPIGSQVISLKSGDDFMVETTNGTREYKILSIS